MVKFKFLTPKFIFKTHDGGGWTDPWKEKTIEFNTKISWTLDDEKDWTFTILVFGFGFVLFSSVWDV